jgi:hypothetical protein
MNPSTPSLDMASNMWGRLSDDIRARLTAAIEHPGEETWDDAYSIILDRDSWTTLWQAVLATEPSFASARAPVTRWVPDDSELGGHSEPVSGWSRTPAAETIIQAINYAVR